MANSEDKHRSFIERLNREIDENIAYCNERLPKSYAKLGDLLKEIDLNTCMTNFSTLQLFGATVNSWRPKRIEALFVSGQSVLDSINPIRGGISIVFPNLKELDESIPSFGLSNRKRWSLVCSHEFKKADESVTSYLRLSDDEETRNRWNHKFELNYNIKLKGPRTLNIELTVQNKDTTESDFSSLIQAYFKLDNIRNAKLYGLKDTNYIDQLNNDNEIQDKDEFVVINSETHRIYYNTSDEHVLETGNENKFRIKIRKENCSDTVIWNPWIEKSKEIHGFGENEYNKMIYIGVGFSKNRLILKPNESFTMRQEIIIETD